MEVGIFYVGDIPAYAHLGGLAAAVCKQSMPDVEVVHLTDMDTKPLDNVDKVNRLEKDCPLAVFRMKHHQTRGEWLFIDVDVLVLKDVSDMFYEGFDIAVASRVPGDGADHEGFREMPHNMGVVFSRSPAFWRDVERELLTYDAKMQEWMGDQLAMCRTMKKWIYRAKILKGEIYNFPPNSPLVGDASIVHYKGKRKPWMLQRANEILDKRKSA